ncbi:MAG: hypothetical protein NC092_13220 [Butyrivibrio sp.]|nr:hypothetical protein [Muribaculum sp.]MCM1553632.1 hypothetical protein [Butyrivibrio sp.]
MSDTTPMRETTAYDGRKLWDEILKAIVDIMPEQLFPLFKEVYGKAYPEGTPITLLSTETSTFWESAEEPPSSTFMDIALVVDGTDYYHLECQMKNDNEMVIRMFAYDAHFAITHTKNIDADTGDITLRFPRSAVIYPENNSAIPDYLQCHILFQDNSEHIYKIPTIKIQSYSLEEISEKHLTLFLPYKILCFRTQKNLKKLTKKELTDYLNEVILILENEVSAGNLTELQCGDYVKLIHHTAERVFAEHSELQGEVDRMTARLLKLPSDEYREMKAEYEAKLSRQETEIAKQKDIYEAKIAKQNEEIAKQTAKYEAEIQRLQEQLRLAGAN